MLRLIGADSNARCPSRQLDSAHIHCVALETELAFEMELDQFGETEAPT